MSEVTSETPLAWDWVTETDSDIEAKLKAKVAPKPLKANENEYGDLGHSMGFRTRAVGSAFCPNREPRRTSNCSP